MKGARTKMPQARALSGLRHEGQGPLVEGKAANSLQRNGGQPLPPYLRTRMEAAFGRDLGEVRFHNDDQAHAEAASLHAKAFTVGEHVVFGAQRYAPESREGTRLIAHELAHVIQQRQGGPAPELNANAPHEQRADQAAEAVTTGTHHGIAARGVGGTGVGIAREEEDEDDWFGSIRDVARSAKAAVRDQIPEEYRPLARKAVESIADTAVNLPVSFIPGATMVTDGMGSTGLRMVEAGLTGEGDPLDEVKAVARDTALESLGTVKGVATQATEVVDTALWLGDEYKSLRKTVDDSTGLGFLMDGIVDFTGTARALGDASDMAKDAGLVDKQTGQASITAPMSEVMNEGATWLQDTIGGAKHDEGLFTPMEEAEIKAAIGTQVVLAFTGAEEVKVAMNVVGVLGSLRGIVTTVRNDPNWHKNSAFWSGLIGMALSLVGLKHTMAASKITSIVLKYGWVAAAIPPMTQLAFDYFDTSLSEEERERRVKQGWTAVMHVLKDAVLHVAQGMESPPKSGDKTPAPAKSAPPMLEETTPTVKVPAAATETPTPAPSKPATPPTTSPVAAPPTLKQAPKPAPDTTPAVKQTSKPISGGNKGKSSQKTPRATTGKPRPALDPMEIRLRAIEEIPLKPETRKQTIEAITEIRKRMGSDRSSAEKLLDGLEEHIGNVAQGRSTKGQVLQDVQDVQSLVATEKGPGGKTRQTTGDLDRAMIEEGRPHPKISKKASVTEGERLGTEGGVSKAKQDGIQVAQWESPQHLKGEYGTGIDGYGTRGDKVVVLEYKFGGSDLNESSGVRQMSNEWIGRKIAELETVGDRATAQMLLAAAQEGRLQGAVYWTRQQSKGLATSRRSAPQLRDKLSSENIRPSGLIQYAPTKVTAAYQARLAEIQQSIASGRLPRNL